jgi:M6 family metalloprotease-like protein
MSPNVASRHRPWALAAIMVVAAAGMAAAVLLAAPSQAVPAHPEAVTLTQPDGERFKARLFGDEWYNGHETVDGHTILRGERGVWRYARQDARGELRVSELVVGRDDPVMGKHLRDRVLTARAERHRKSASREVRIAEGVGGPAASPSIGQDRSLVILATFNDQGSLGTTAAQWSSAYFNPTKSVSQYFAANSGGQFGLVPAAESHGTVNDGVVGWVNVGINHPNNSISDVSNRLATRAAIIAADPYVNYAAYDTNGDGVVRNTELHVTVIAAGQEASCCAGYGGARSLWGHQWVLQGSEIPTVDGKWVGGWGYTQFGEMHGDHMAAMGIMVHEIGHDLGLPDLYDIDGSSNGVGTWSAMGGGSWGYVPGVDPYEGMTPPLMDAWSRSFKGWITPTVITGTQTTTLNAATTGTAGVAVQMLPNPDGPHDWSWQGSGTGEYFLVENRQRTGYDASLPGSGVVVWHIDESRGNNANDVARLVDIEEADGAMTGRGDAGDTFRAGGATAFTGATTPNSNLNSGAPSGVSMSGVSASGVAMSATFTAPGGSSAPTNDHFANATAVSSRVFDATVNNTGATAEVGEFSQAGCPIGRTVWYRYTPARDVRVTADTSGSGIDTVLNVWRGTSLANLTAHSCNDDVSPGTETTSRVPEFVAQAGQTYYFQVGGYYDSGANTVAVGNIHTHVRVRPLNDDFAQATTLAGTGGAATGNNQNASKEPGEPAVTGNAGGGSVWWSWTAPSSGQVVVDTQGSGAQVDTLLGVYAGASVNGLSLVAENDDIDATSNRWSRVTFDAVAGSTYRIAVDTYDNASPGELKVSWSLRASSTPGAPTNVTASAGDASAVVSWSPGPDNGSPITGYTVTASPGGVTTNLGAAATSTTIGGLTNGTAYTFTVRATNALGDGPPSAPSNQVVPAASVVPTDLAVSMSLVDRPERTGFAYRVRVERTGATSGTAVEVSVTVPASVVLESRAGCAGGRVLVCDLGVVASGAAAVLDLGVRPLSPGPHEASVSVAAPDASPGNNSASARAGVGFVCDNAPTAARDKVTGTAGDDVLCGLGGGDTLSGRGGDDLLFGGRGDDKLDGGTGKDWLYGHQGKDRLVGGPGRDRLDGGPQRDTCSERSDKRVSCEL